MFLVIVAIIIGAVTGIVDVYLQQRLGSSYGALFQILVMGIVAGSIMLLALFGLHRTDLDHWFLRPEPTDNGTELHDHI